MKCMHEFYVWLFVANCLYVLLLLLLSLLFLVHVVCGNVKSHQKSNSCNCCRIYMNKIKMDGFFFSFFIPFPFIVIPFFCFTFFSLDSVVTILFCKRLYCLYVAEMWMLDRCIVYIMYVSIFFSVSL